MYLYLVSSELVAMAFDRKVIKQFVFIFIGRHYFFIIIIIYL